MDGMTMDLASSYISIRIAKIPSLCGEKRRYTEERALPNNPNTACNFIGGSDQFGDVYAIAAVGDDFMDRIMGDPG